MTEAQEKLVGRVLSSSQFVYADSLKRILQYICAHASTVDAPTLKEHEIATQTLNRPDSFDPKLDPVVRVSMTHIREKLSAYFETEGADEPLRLTIPKGRYRAVFEAPEELRQAPIAADNSAPSLHRFWQPYLLPQANNVILHTEPLFFRDQEHGTYIRNLYVNDRATGVQELMHRDPELAKRPLGPCFHYLSSGEVYCMLSLTRMFHNLNARADTRNSRISFWNEVRDANLILLGCTRTNSFMDSLQGDDAGYVLTDDAIEVVDPRPPEQASYRESRFKDGKLHRFTEYALITRRPGPAPDRSVTVISSNHGNAVLGAGHFLTLDQQVEKLLRQMGQDGSEPLPSQFQIILRVDMIDFDDEVVNVEYVAHRALAHDVATR